ncbi:transketolase [Candidatus Epulonipiscium viviparus]|uniref:transketolase n=1 Tax=Candidatus Epulonipiscium viviparus TaxID=420336 RepID=UPI00016C033A|nr:transketolase [Candidatus Epulopiscium viviparus]
MADKQLVARLKAQAKTVRLTLLEMIYKAQSGHPGGSLSATEFMTALYFNELKVDPQNPKWEDRDRFVLSKGHVCPVLYTCLGLRGYFDTEILGTLRKEGSILQGHPDMKRCPGIDISTGSLGQGISVAVGMAIAGKRDAKNYRVFTLLGDGETNEGQVWEAAQTAAKYQLDNLVVIVDNNNLQNDDSCDVVMPTLDLAKKFEAFGFETFAIDGHDMNAVLDAFAAARNKNGKPKCIVGKTVKGKGVSYMENVVIWHGMAPNDDEYAKAIKDIEEGVF